MRGCSLGFLLAFLGLTNKAFEACQQQTARISWSRYSLFVFNLKLLVVCLFAAGQTEVLSRACHTLPPLISLTPPFYCPSSPHHPLALGHSEWFKVDSLAFGLLEGHKSVQLLLCSHPLCSQLDIV